VKRAPPRKIAFATLSAFCAALAAPAWGDDRAPPDAPLPVARPADLDGAPAQNQAGAEKSAAGEKPGADDAASPRGQFRVLLRREAAKAGLPFDIADAVMAIESGYDPTVIGTVGEIGLMQVRPETAAMLGFSGDAAELARPEVNVHYGVAYLAEAWRLANGDVCRALMKYRAGHGEEQMSELSAAYCGRARTHLSAVGSPFAADVSVPAVVDPGVSGAAPRAPGARIARIRLPRIRTAAVSRAFWAAEEARVAALTRRIEAKWRRVASR
jgi:soluble lytic murein transglycosylase-like protein